MSQDAAMRARVDGRQRYELATVWELRAGGFRARCLAITAGYELQVHDGTAWRSIRIVEDPRVVLDAVLISRTFAKWLANASHLAGRHRL